MTKFLTAESAVLLTEKDVARYLKERPDFFLRNKQLLASLNIPHTERGTISLVEIQLSRLRDRVAELEEEITQLMTVAVGNENLYRAIGQAHQELFLAKNEAAIHQILARLGKTLNLSVNLRFYDSVQHPIVKLDVQRIKTSHFAGQRVYQGRLRRADGGIFVENAPELGSYLLLPISIADKELGFLSFASQEGGHFQPSMDTLFVEQLAKHITVLAIALINEKKAN